MKRKSYSGTIHPILPAFFTLLLVMLLANAPIVAQTASWRSTTCQVPIQRTGYFAILQIVRLSVPLSVAHRISPLGIVTKS